MAIADAFRLARDLDLNGTAETFALVGHCCAHLNGWFQPMIDDGRRLWMVVVVALSPQMSLGWRRGRAGGLLQSIRRRVHRSGEIIVEKMRRAHSPQDVLGRPGCQRYLLTSIASPAPIQPRSWRQAGRHGAERASMRRPPCERRASLEAPSAPLCPGRQPSPPRARSLS